MFGLLFRVVAAIFATNFVQRLRSNVGEFRVLIAGRIAPAAMRSTIEVPPPCPHHHHDFFEEYTAPPPPPPTMCPPPPPSHALAIYTPPPSAYGVWTMPSVPLALAIGLLILLSTVLFLTCLRCLRRPHRSHPSRFASWFAPKKIRADLDAMNRQVTIYRILWRRTWVRAITLRNLYNTTKSEVARLSGELVQANTHLFLNEEFLKEGGWKKIALALQEVVDNFARILDTTRESSLPALEQLFQHTASLEEENEVLEQDLQREKAAALHHRNANNLAGTLAATDLKAAKLEHERVVALLTQDNKAQQAKHRRELATAVKEAGAREKQLISEAKKGLMAKNARALVRARSQIKREQSQASSRIRSATTKACRRLRAAKTKADSLLKEERSRAASQLEAERKKADSQLKRERKKSAALLKEERSKKTVAAAAIIAATTTTTTTAALTAPIAPAVPVAPVAPSAPTAPLALPVPSFSAVAAAAAAAQKLLEAEKQAEALEAQVTDLEGNLIGSQVQVVELQDTIDELRHERTKSGAETGAKVARIRELEARITNLEAQLTSGTDERAARITELEASNALIPGLEARILERETYTASLEAHNLELQTLGQSVKTAYDAAVQSHEAQVAAQQGNDSEVQVGIAGLQYTIEQLSGELQQERNNSNNNSNNRAAETDAYATRISTLESQIMGMELAARDLKALYDTTVQGLEAQVAELTSNYVDPQAARDLKALYDATVQGLEAQIADLTSNLLESQAARDLKASYDVAVQGLEAQIAEMRINLFESQPVRDLKASYDVKFQDLEAQVEDITRSYVDSQATIVDLNDRIEQLQTQGLNAMTDSSPEDDACTIFQLQARVLQLEESAQITKDFTASNMKSMRESRVQVTKKLREAETKVIALEDDLTLSENRKNELQEDCDESQQQILELEGNLADFGIEILDLKSQLKSLEETLSA